MISPILNAHIALGICESRKIDAMLTSAQG
ncbi:uncharacterized protein METZ01_LOCUS381751, partial [marine metagenome]